jgi:triacylglycerol lipase
MRDGDVVFLVPGLFGFNTFGNKIEDQISYFDRVIARLAATTGLAPNRFIVHEPAPTGPLWVRVFGLSELVQKTIAEPPDGRPVERIHLVGHSTGGVDIRLFANTRYHWPDEPKDRTAVLDKVASIVPISAPLLGTPIARRLRGALEITIPNLFLLSILAKQQQHVKISESMLVLYTSILHAASGGGPQESVLRLLGGLSKDAASDVGRFLTDIVNDHPLIDELTPLAMERLNARIAGGDTRTLDCFVTVAPKPKVWNGLVAGLGIQGLQFAVYAFAYWTTYPDDDDAKKLAFPVGQWIGDPKDVAALVADTANDGIVPSGSQTLDGTAAGIVLGDHLDVIGHFDSGSNGFHGTTVFKSGAGFDDPRFEAVWDAVATIVSRP